MHSDELPKKVNFKIIAIKLAISAFLFFIVYKYFIDYNFFKLFYNLNIYNIAVLSVAILVLSSLGGLRLWFLLKLQEYSHKLVHTVKVRLVTQGYGIVLPGGYAGDLIAMMCLSEYPKRPISKTFGVLLTDRIIGLLSIFITMIFIYIHYFNDIFSINKFTISHVNIFIYGIIFLSILSFIVYKFKKSFFDKCVYALKISFNVLISYKKKKIELFFLTLFSILLHLLSCYFLWIVSSDLGETSFMRVAFSVSLTAILSLIPVSYNGLGIREAVFLTVLPNEFFSEEATLVLSLTWWAVSLITLSVSASILSFLTPMGFTKRKQHEPT